MRITRKFINARFDRVAEALGWNTGDRWTTNGNGTVSGAVIGHVSLDYNATYGGFDITQIVNTAGGEKSLIGNEPFGNRLSGRELVAWLDGAMFAARHKQSMAIAACKLISEKATGDRLTTEELRICDAVTKAERS